MRSQRLDLRLLVDAEHEGVVRRRHVQPDNIADLLTNCGSFDREKVSVRSGRRPNALQTRRTALGETPA